MWKSEIQGTLLLQKQNEKAFILLTIEIKMTFTERNILYIRFTGHSVPWVEWRNRLQSFLVIIFSVYMFGLYLQYSHLVDSFCMWIFTMYGHLLDRFFFFFFSIPLYVNIHSQPPSGLFWYALCDNSPCQVFLISIHKRGNCLSGKHTLKVVVCAATRGLLLPMSFKFSIMK